MGTIEDVSEKIKCPKCKNAVNATIISNETRKTSIRGVKVNRVVKLASHKKDGFFSLKCPESGSIRTLSIWYPNNKVKKAKCTHCKQNVSALIIKKHSRNDGHNRPYTKETTITVLKLLSHSRVTHHRDRIGNFQLRKCNGTGKIVKEKNVDFIDNCHP